MPLTLTVFDASGAAMRCGIACAVGRVVIHCGTVDVAYDEMSNVGKSGALSVDERSTPIGKPIVDKDGSGMTT